MDVPVDGNGRTPAGDGLDTSDWFQSQLPPAAEQPEARIELSTLEPGLPPLPPLSEVTEQAREDGGLTPSP
jgi:hypothetical protein